MIYVTTGMCAETVCPRCKVLLYTYWVYPSTRYNRVRESLQAAFVSWSNRTVWASLLLSRQLYVIDSAVVILSSRGSGMQASCYVRKRYLCWRTILCLNRNDVRALIAKSSQDRGSISVIQHTSLITLIALTIPCLSCPRVSHHLTRLPIYIALVRAMRRVKRKKPSSPGGVGS
jgi:hypothetical protein